MEVRQLIDASVFSSFFVAYFVRWLRCAFVVTFPKYGFVCVGSIVRAAIEHALVDATYWLSKWKTVD